MEKELLTLIQKEFPVTKRPFAHLANELGVTEEEVLDTYRKLKEERIIRQTSAIFDTKSLGYRSSLVAFQVDDIEKAAAFVNTHPGVSHNYERDHDFNLWFTIAVEPDSRLGLEKTVALMAQRTNAKEYIILPTKKMFKIQVQLDVAGKKSKKEKVTKKKKIDFELEPVHYKLIKELQEDIEPVAEPFEKIVQKLGLSYEELQQEVQRLQDGGYMRRFASILYHRKAGFNANAMVVWSVDEEKAQEIGQKVAEFSAVSHCYLRPTYPNWPYPLFSMIHGKSKEEVEAVVKEIEAEIAPKEYRYLYSTREFKKQRIRYFSDAFKEWEQQYGG
ncbi:siroheme decarboxylase subunit alpha [Nitratiruptor sp. SB155-2]|uniref:siroheme decarboxylase subunit alpha n=1 Tax=Nitratiruptor sp. (strain SB155-2) TaxID=387092 RepID=UPI00015870DC|nr:Lrp/AsnC family transcriptional regulator [Nitratiruptor sp. SB155-2]BAF70881.1 transcriptional regulator, AsnC/Lrp family [Nitratiruptor sp. SB155-2]